MKFWRRGWRRWKREYWLILILLAVINLIKGRTTEPPSFLGSWLFGPPPRNGGAGESLG